VFQGGGSADVEQRNTEAVRRVLARNVFLERERAGLTQAALSAKARLSRATLALIEAGQADPRLGTLVTLAAALGVSAADLIRNGENPTP
jgi:transcriptional regulator with XRE-family HTH domain